ncbi:hypothetical protein, partial [Aurantimonas coralicida]|uniref:hypothetical protein n=1 Tax=Aurantimonas coralicida TaxID=182270 RepID=UPI0023895C74
APPRIKLAYNHSPFWHNRDIAEKKFREKQENFLKPRFTEPTDFMSCFPGELQPSSFALDQLNADGSVKPVRATPTHCQTKLTTNNAPLTGVG